jgi:hypothetical protein
LHDRRYIPSFGDVKDLIHWIGLSDLEFGRYNNCNFYEDCGFATWSRSSKLVVENLADHPERVIFNFSLLVDCDQDGAAGHGSRRNGREVKRLGFAWTQ